MTYSTKEFVAKDDNGNVTSSVQVFVVDENSDGDNVQTTGGIQQVHSGDVLVQCPNPNFWDVIPESVWADSGYADASAQDAPAPVAPEPAPADPQQPAE